MAKPGGRKKVDIDKEIYQIKGPCKTKFIAELFGVSERRVQQMTEEQKILETVSVKEGGRRVNRYDLAPTIQRYIRHLSERAKKKETPLTDAENESAKLEAEAKYKQAKAKMEELKLKELQGELHRSEDVKEIVTNNVMLIRGMLLALPGQLAVDMESAKTAAEASEIMKRAVHRVLLDLSRYEYDGDAYKELVKERYGMSGGGGDEEETGKTEK